MKKAIKKKMQKKGRCEEMLFAGFGGQGIMFMGKLLTLAGLLAKKHVTWMPSYGAEVRGGTAYSMTKISDSEIASPIVKDMDALVVMNEPSLLKYGGKLKKGAFLILNTSLIDNIPKRKDISIVKVPMTAIAAKLGNSRCANMVAIGALLKRSKTLSLKDTVNALREMLKDKEDLFLINKKALETGYKKG